MGPGSRTSFWEAARQCLLAERVLGTVRLAEPSLAGNPSCPLIPGATPGASLASQHIKNTCSVGRSGPVVAFCAKLDGAVAGLQPGAALSSATVHALFLMARKVLSVSHE